MDPWLRDHYAGVHGEPLRRRYRHPRPPITPRRASVRRADDVLGDIARIYRRRRAAEVLGAVFLALVVVLLVAGVVAIVVLATGRVS